MFLPLLLASAISIPPCWDIFDGALRHSANAAHPAFVSYDERISITADDRPLLFSLAHVDYRDDGTARVADQRFDYHPIITRRAEPGPPELGPYGNSRAAWLPLDGNEAGLPVISSVRVGGKVTCTVAGIEKYKGHDAYHLVFGNVPTDRPTVKALWVDTTTGDMWKLIVSGYVLFAGGAGAQPLTDFEVELAYRGPYLVVDHVVWQYTRREYGQSSTYFGEYHLSGFEFPRNLPPALFEDVSKQQER